MAKKRESTFVDVAAIGKIGGEARANNMTKEERIASAKKAAAARWKDKKPAAKKAGKKTNG